MFYAWNHLKVRFTGARQVQMQFSNAVQKRHHMHLLAWSRQLAGRGVPRLPSPKNMINVVGLYGIVWCGIARWLPGHESMGWSMTASIRWMGDRMREPLRAVTYSIAYVKNGRDDWFHCLQAPAARHTLVLNCSSRTQTAIVIVKSFMENAKFSSENWHWGCQCNWPIGRSPVFTCFSQTSKSYVNVSTQRIKFAINRDMRKCDTQMLTSLLAFYAVPLHANTEKKQDYHYDYVCRSLFWELQKHERHVFHVFHVFMFYWLFVWLCFFQWHFIDLFSCIAASLFNKLTYLLTYLSTVSCRQRTEKET